MNRSFPLLIQAVKALFPVFLLLPFSWPRPAESAPAAHILTPAPAKPPRLNGTKVLGVRPNSPVLHKIAATGEKPLHYTIRNLPEGMHLDPNTGIITGTLSKPGDYALQVQVSNNAGKAERRLTIKVGPTIALTPPMGWSSWNAFGLSVTQDKVRAIAQAMIDKGLVDHGWTYVNIDDGWEAAQRTNDGTLLGNEKFPDLPTSTSPEAWFETCGGKRTWALTRHNSARNLPLMVLRSSG